LDEETEK
jgi:hypothetical protein